VPLAPDRLAGSNGSMLDFAESYAAEVEAKVDERRERRLKGFAVTETVTQPA